MRNEAYGRRLCEDFYQEAGLWNTPCDLEEHVGIGLQLKHPKNAKVITAETVTTSRPVSEKRGGYSVKILL